MRGKRTLAKLERKKKRSIARIENAAIVALACLALFLAGRTGVFQNTLTGLAPGQTLENGLTVGPVVSLAGETPVRLAVRTSSGRCGMEYDQSAVDALYAAGLEGLLSDSLLAMDPPSVVSEEAWQEALTGSETWVLYDFLDNIAFSDQDRQGAGSGRYFLLTARGQRADSLYYYNEEARTFYGGQVREDIALPEAVAEATPNGVRFAFEDQETAETLSPYMLLLDEAPICPVYTASNPLSQMDSAGWNQLLESLDFNAKAASPYTTVSGNVIREGADTLRIQNDGTLQFHNSDSGEVRYQALSSREKDLERKAREILDNITSAGRGEAKLTCQSIRTLDNGQTEVVFYYVLNGARVQLWGDGWAARFLFQGADVISYTILLRQYTTSELICPLLPVRQAAAAAAAMGRRGTELQVVYQDNGDQQILASWTVREPR